MPVAAGCSRVTIHFGYDGCHGNYDSNGKNSQNRFRQMRKLDLKRDIKKTSYDNRGDPKQNGLSPLRQGIIFVAHCSRVGPTTEDVKLPTVGFTERRPPALTVASGLFQAGSGWRQFRAGW